MENLSKKTSILQKFRKSDMIKDKYLKKEWKLLKKQDKPLHFNSPDEAQFKISELAGIYPNAEFKIQVIEIYNHAYFSILIYQPE